MPIALFIKNNNNVHYIENKLYYYDIYFPPPAPLQFYQICM